MKNETNTKSMKTELLNPEREFYVYTPADGNEDGMYIGLTITEAKERAALASQSLRESGIDSIALVNRRDSGATVWSCGGVAKNIF
jgi:hypothetical protein